MFLLLLVSAVTAGYVAPVDHLWPHGIVCYKINPNVVSESLIESRMKYVQDATNGTIQFITSSECLSGQYPQGTCGEDCLDTVEFAFTEKTLHPTEYVPERGLRNVLRTLAYTIVLNSKFKTLANFIGDYDPDSLLHASDQDSPDEARVLCDPLPTCVEMDPRSAFLNCLPLGFVELLCRYDGNDADDCFTPQEGHEIQYAELLRNSRLVI